MPNKQNKQKKQNATTRKAPYNIPKTIRPTISGKGDYKIAGMSTAGLAGKAGGMLGSYLGGPLGGSLGSALGNIFGSITGLGTYKVNSNTLVSQNSVPVFKNSANGSVEVIHREFLADISGSVGFALTSYPVNAGMLQTFPFLAQLASNYEQVEYLGLIFEFKTTCANSVGTTNTALGTVIMATEYDVLDSVFTTKQQMEAYEYSCSTIPSQSIIHPVECDPRQNVLAHQYVRSGSIPAGADLRFYDLGNFQIATVGMQAAAVIGELWVSYHVRLLKPKLQPPIGSSTIRSGTTVTPTTPFGTAGTLTTGTYQPVASNVNANFSFTNLIVGVEYGVAATCTGGTITACAVNFVSGITPVNSWPALLGAGGGSAAHNFTFIASSSTANFSMGVVATTLASTSIFIAALNPTPTF